MKMTALKVLFLLTLYLICVKKHYPKQINVLEKCLGFSPTPSYINEADLRRDFEGFGRKMECKWYFRNESQDIPSGVSTFKPKSSWNPPKGSPVLELFLSKVKEDIFSILREHPNKFNLNNKNHLTTHSFQNNRSVIIKSADKGSAAVVRNRQDYLKEVYSSICKEVEVTEKDLVDLTVKNNKIFSILNLIFKKLPMLENFNYYLRF